MRSVLILAIFVLLLTSCGDDFPNAPKLEFCKLKIDETTDVCESIHKFPESDCEAVGGEIVKTCKEEGQED